MDLNCDPELARGYTSKSQQSRVIHEQWLEREGYCLNCDGDRLQCMQPNTEARDFCCPICDHPYELKAKSGGLPKKICDGAFRSMMGRILDRSVASLLLLEYNAMLNVHGLTAIHRCFITPDVIEKRTPLSPTARRAGWVGCNILLSHIPIEGRIPLVSNRSVIPRSIVRSRFQSVSRLSQLSVDERGWTALTLRILHRLNKPSFTLRDVYALESNFALEYPNNKNLRAKIRQQLQRLRDSGLLEFQGNGHYRFK
jgi:type II restriction enzyme